jgi:hypothetical protein
MATSAPTLFTSSLPELYERLLVQPLFRSFADELLNRAGVRPDDRLLDVACGTGTGACSQKAAFERFTSRPLCGGFGSAARYRAAERDGRRRA